MSENKNEKNYSKIIAVIDDELLTFLMKHIPHEDFDLKHASSYPEVES